MVHTANRIPAYANCLGPGSVLPPVAIRPLWRGTFRAHSSRAHAPHRVADPPRMQKTESLRRNEQVLESSTRLRAGARDRGLRRVADSPDREASLAIDARYCSYIQYCSEVATYVRLLCNAISSAWDRERQCSNGIHML